MPLRVIHSIGFCHLAIRADKHGYARRFFLIGAIGGTIGHGDVAVGIAQQLSRVTVFVGPLFQVIR